MKKSTFIFIAFLLHSGYLRLGIIASLIPYDLWAFIIWIWGIYGIIRYGYNSVEKSIWLNTRTLIIVFLIGVLLSLVSTFFNHDQNPFRVLISQRPMYNLFYFYVWIKIRPKEFEIIDAIRQVAYIAIVFGYLSLIFPTLLISPSYIKEFYKNNENSTDVLMFAPGLLSFGLFYFYYLLYKFKFVMNKVDIVAFLMLLVLLFLFQNRSTYIGMAMAVLYTFFTVNGKKKIWLIFVLLPLLFFTFNNVQLIVSSLFKETQIQLSDPNYNRNVAMNYFLLSYNGDNIGQILLGNGQPSHGGYLTDMEIAGKELGADLSDIGLLGDWFKFGFIPILTILLLMLQGLFHVRIPLYLKFIIIHALLVPTIYSFSSWTGSFMFAIYLYLIVYKKYGRFDNNRKLQHISGNSKLSE